jgi:hypothetical protein
MRSADGKAQESDSMTFKATVAFSRRECATTMDEFDQSRELGGKT